MLFGLASAAERTAAAVTRPAVFHGQSFRLALLFAAGPGKHGEAGETGGPNLINDVLIEGSHAHGLSVRSDVLGTLLGLLRLEERGPLLASDLSLMLGFPVSLADLT